MKKRPRENDEDSDNQNEERDRMYIENLKNSIIEIRSEGFVDKGKIMEIRESKNDVTITYKSRWGEIDQISLYFDEFQEIKETGRCITMDGEIVIREL
jgi:hypothetical protein